MDAGGTIRADGHNLDLYGMVLIRRDRICASPEGARRGQRAFMAMRQLWKDNPSVAALWPPRARRKQCAGSDFNGNVVVANGALTASVKNAVVPFPDGTQRMLHCMKSPEHWFEDFGTAKIRRQQPKAKRSKRSG